MFFNSNQAKIDTAFSLLEIRDDFVLILTRIVYSGCLTNSNENQIIEEIDKLRLNLQDKFLFIEDNKALKFSIEKSKNEFESFINIKKTEILILEKSLDFNTRFSNIRNKFKVLFEGAYSNGLVTKEHFLQLEEKNRMYCDMFNIAVNNTLIPDIEKMLFENNLESYFLDIFHLYKKITKKR
jgi:hypothetical protein